MDNEDKRKKIKKGIKSNERWVIFWVIVFFLVAVGIAWSIVSQRQITRDSGGTIAKVDSLTCKSNDFLYPFFEYNASDQKEFKIITTFANGTIRSISLQQMLYYSDESLAKQSETENHSAMNLQFKKDGMEADSLDASYSLMRDGLRFSIYTTADNLVGAAAKYFLLDNVSGNNLDAVKQAYEAMGFECTSNISN